jgi:hypothetical protein
MNHIAEAPSRDTRRWTAPAYSRRLSDEILIAFEDAYKNDEFEVASQLLRVLERMVLRQRLYPARARHRIQAELTAAQRLLWQLHHREDLGEAGADQDRPISQPPRQWASLS